MARPTAWRPPLQEGPPANGAAVASTKGTPPGQRTSGNTPLTEATNVVDGRRAHGISTKRLKRHSASTRTDSLAALVRAAAERVRSDDVTWRGSEESNPHYEQPRRRGDRRNRSQEVEGARKRAAALSTIPATTLRKVLANTEFTGCISAKGRLQSITAEPGNVVGGGLSEQQQRWLEADYRTLTTSLLHEGSHSGFQLTGREARLHAGTLDTATFTLTTTQLRADEIGIEVNSWNNQRERNRTTRVKSMAAPRVKSMAAVTQMAVKIASADNALPWPVQPSFTQCSEVISVPLTQEDRKQKRVWSTAAQFLRTCRLARKRRLKQVHCDERRKQRRNTVRERRFRTGVWLDATKATGDVTTYQHDGQRPRLNRGVIRERVANVMRGMEFYVKARRRPRSDRPETTAATTEPTVPTEPHAKAPRSARGPTPPKFTLQKVYTVVAVRTGGRRVYRKHHVLRVLLHLQAACGDIESNPGPPRAQDTGFLSILDKVQGQRRQDFTYMTMLSRTRVYRKSLLGHSRSYARTMAMLLGRYREAKAEYQTTAQTRRSQRPADYDTQLAQRRHTMDAAHCWMLAAGAILYRPVKSQDGRRFKHVPHYTLDQRYRLFEGKQWNQIIRTLTSREATLKPKRGKKIRGLQGRNRPQTEATGFTNAPEDTLTGKADAKATYLCSDGRPGKALKQLAAHPRVNVDEDVVQIMRDMNPTPADEHRVPDGGMDEYIKGYNSRHPNAKISMNDVKPLVITEDELEQAVYRMDSTRAPGPDQITVHMLKAIFNRNGYPTDAKAALARVYMTEYANDLINADRMPKEYYQLLSAGFLVALHKTKESALAQLSAEERIAAVQLVLRPIVITSALQCAIANAVLRQFQADITDDMEPLQFACGTKAGQQVMMLGMQEFLAAHKNEDLVVYSADTTNAYNSIPRTQVLDSILEDETLRPLFRLLYSSIGHSSDLHLQTDDGDYVKLKSETGVRQGAADSTFGFAKGAQAAMKEVQEAVTRDGSTGTANFFADDGASIAGVTKTFAIHRAYPKWWAKAGLKLNYTKSWVYYTTPAARQKMYAHCKSMDPDCTRKRDGSIVASADFMRSHSDLDSNILMPKEFEHKAMAESGDRAISRLARQGFVFAGCPIGTHEFEAAAAMLKAQSIGDKLRTVASKYKRGKGHMQTLHSMLFYAGQTKFDYWLQLMHPERVQDAAATFDKELLQAISIAWGRPELTEDSEDGDLLRERLFTRLRHGGCGFRSKEQLARTGVSIVATILKIGPRLIDHTTKDLNGYEQTLPGLFQKLEPVFGTGTFNDSPNAKTTRWKKAVTKQEDGDIDSHLGSILNDYWPKCQAAAGATDNNPLTAEDNPLTAAVEAAGADMEGDNQSAQLLEPIDEHKILNTLNTFGTSQAEDTETGDLIDGMEYRRNPIRSALLDSCPRGRMMRFLAALPTQANNLDTRDFQEAIATVLGTNSVWSKFLIDHYSPDTPELRQPAGKKDSNTASASSSSNDTNATDGASNGAPTENRKGPTPWTPHASHIRAATGSLAAIATTCRHDTLNLYSGEQARNAGLGHALGFEETSTFRRRKASQMRTAARAGPAPNVDEQGSDDVIWKPDSFHVGHETDDNWLPIDGTRETRYVDFKTQKVTAQHPSYFNSGSASSATSSYSRAILSTRADGETAQVKRAPHAPADNYQHHEKKGILRKFKKADEKYPHPEDPTRGAGTHTYWQDQVRNTNVYVPAVDGYGAWSKDADKLMRIYAGEKAMNYWEHYNHSSKIISQRVFLSAFREEFAVAAARTMSTYLRTLAKLTTQGNCPRHQLERTLAQERDRFKRHHPGIYRPPSSPPQYLASPGRTSRFDRMQGGPSTHDDRWVDGAEEQRHMQECQTAQQERMRASQAAQYSLYNAPPHQHAGRPSPPHTPPPPHFIDDQEQRRDDEQHSPAADADGARADPTPLATDSQPLPTPPPPTDAARGEPQTATRRPTPESPSQTVQNRRARRSTLRTRLSRSGPADGTPPSRKRARSASRDGDDRVDGTPAPRRSRGLTQPSPAAASTTHEVVLADLAAQSPTQT